MYTAPLQNHRWLFVDRGDGYDDELEEEEEERMGRRMVLDEGMVETRLGGEVLLFGGGWRVGVGGGRR